MQNESIPLRSVPVAGDVSHPRSGWEPRNPVDLVRREDGPKLTRGTDGRLPHWPEAFRTPSSG